ncbi:MAG: site-specific integrase [Clostridium sp.]|nr:site-specific integrase [Clostridium sp.]
MPRRGENIRKRSDGRWEGRFIQRRDIDGKACYRSIYGKSYAEVKGKLAQRNDALKEERAGEKPAAFGDILQLWLEDRKIKLKRQSYAKYAGMIKRHLMDGLGDKHLSSLNATQINRHLEQKLREGLAVTTVRTLGFIAASALTFAAELGICPPPVGKFHRPSKCRAEPCVFSVAEQRRLEEHLLGAVTPTGLGILLCLHTGLRIGELCGLRLEDIDILSATLHVRRTVCRLAKGGGGTELTIGEPKSASSRRAIPLTPCIAMLLDEQLRERRQKEGNTAVFLPSPEGRYLDPRTLQYRFKKILRDCGLPERKFHALRHSFATRCVEAGVDVKSLSEILGHADVGTTLNIYVHSSMEQKRIQLDKLAHFSGQRRGQATL